VSGPVFAHVTARTCETSGRARGLQQSYFASDGKTRRLRQEPLTHRPTHRLRRDRLGAEPARSTRSSQFGLRRTSPREQFLLVRMEYLRSRPGSEPAPAPPWPADPTTARRLHRALGRRSALAGAAAGKTAEARSRGNRDCARHARWPSPRITTRGAWGGARATRVASRTKGSVSHASSTVRVPKR
jgi:hypothetical protein